jgi:hypothetical protein
MFSNCKHGLLLNLKDVYKGINAYNLCMLKHSYTLEKVSNFLFVVLSAYLILKDNNRAVKNLSNRFYYIIFYNYILFGYVFLTFSKIGK